MVRVRPEPRDGFVSGAPFGRRVAEGFPAMKIKNRIKGLAVLPHDRILPCPLNWRLHPDNQKEALRGLLADVGVIDTILQPEKYPDLYGNIDHVVRINYYPPRGDAKEGWDNIDIVGWLGYPMQIKVNFLCRDSILAAPIVLDLALFMDFAHRAGMSGIQEWLSFYWKSPMTPEGLYPEHDLFIQLMKLKNTLRYTKGDDLITHLGAEYYD